MSSYPGIWQNLAFVKRRLLKMMWLSRQHNGQRLVLTLAARSSCFCCMSDDFSLHTALAQYLLAQKALTNNCARRELTRLQQIGLADSKPKAAVSLHEHHHQQQVPTALPKPSTQHHQYHVPCGQISYLAALSWSCS
jgi:hypothetical protein